MYRIVTFVYHITALRNAQRCKHGLCCGIEGTVAHWLFCSHTRNSASQVALKVQAVVHLPGQVRHIA